MLLQDDRWFNFLCRKENLIVTICRFLTNHGHMDMSIEFLHEIVEYSKVPFFLFFFVCLKKFGPSEIFEFESISTQKSLLQGWLYVMSNDHQRRIFDFELTLLKCLKSLIHVFGLQLACQIPECSVFSNSEFA